MWLVSVSSKRDLQQRPSRKSSRKSASPRVVSFYHFSDKNELAKALLQRYIDMEEAIFRDIEARAYELNEDPLHGFLISLKLLAELLEDLPNGHPGCLIASYCYQSRLFSADIRDLNARALMSWRARFQRQLEKDCRNLSAAP